MAFDTTVFLPLDTHAVFELVTQPERLRRWKTVAARIELEVGGEYRWTITPGHSVMGNILELVPGKKMVLSWGWEGSEDLPPGASTVSIILEGVEGGTNLRLVHAGLNEEQEAGHAQGWNHYLDRLATFSSSGIATADPWTFAPENMDPVVAIEACLVITQRILANISISDLQKPTPCPEMNVEQLVEHLFRSLSNTARGLGLEVAFDSGMNPEVQIADLAQRMVEALGKHGMNGEIDIRIATLPAPIVAALMSMELLIHGWDLSVAIGQGYEVSNVVAGYVLNNCRMIITQEVRDRGLFAPEIKSHETDSEIAQLIAFSGRHTAA
jgi:uncharacterized protein (TIGR03086 family)